MLLFRPREATQSFESRNLAFAMKGMSKKVPYQRVYAPDKAKGGRPHHIREWAEKNGYTSNVSLADAIGVNKSLITNWYSGTTPFGKNQRKLADLFGCTPEELFRHPDEVRVSRAIAKVPPHMRDAFIATIEANAALFDLGNGDSTH